MGQLAENTVLGGILILMTALARRFLRGKINPNAVLVLWAVCALRRFDFDFIYSPHEKSLLSVTIYPSKTTLYQVILR